ncbi:MAG: hypothetical protein ACJAYU_002176 [Bradymonadia bacterium]|jgi:hypothetical protein
MLTRLTLLISLVSLAACTEDVDVGDLAGYVDSIGPASFDGELIAVPFSTWDEDGDRLNVEVSFARGGGDFEMIEVLEDLFSDVAESTEHTFVWNITDENVETAEITIRMNVVERPAAAIELGPFTPATLND